MAHAFVPPPPHFKPRNASHAPQRLPPFMACTHHTSTTLSALEIYMFLVSSFNVHSLCFSRTCLKKANLCSKKENDTQNGHDQHGLAPTRGAVAAMNSSTSACAGVNASPVRNGFLGRQASGGYMMAWGGMHILKADKSGADWSGAGCISTAAAS